VNKKIRLVDTTLRDGEQRPGIAMKIEHKIKIARLLDECRIYEIEAGTPCVGIEGEEYYQELRAIIKHSKISIWSRMNMKDLKKAILCKPDIIHIGVPISYVQIYTKLKKNKVWVHRNIAECMALILAENIQVTVGFEDASRADEGFMVETARHIKTLGGNIIRIADTVGVLTPSRTRNIIQSILTKVDIDIEFHGHNDLGMALANSIVGAGSGARYIDCTVFGIGERSGNCDLREFATAARHNFDMGIDRSKISNIEKTVKEILQKPKK